MGRRYTYPFIFSPLKFRNRKDCNSFPSNLTENATLLGIVDVPSRHGNEICFYASLLIKKLNEAQSRKAELVKLIVDEDGIITKDKNNNIQLKYHFEDLTYVWVHPDESRTLGIICTFKTLDSPNPVSRFTAFRMPSKAKKFAYRLQHIYCNYMDGMHRKASFLSIIMDDIRIPEAPERKCSDPARIEIYRALMRTRYPELPPQRCNSPVEGLHSNEVSYQVPL
ncbi:unnamed protein product [Hymenolepis diminuta]|uniref:PID domain-containing protein n=1 Tax=Hymenolepis diminuta TaxID=6216 RepID=A0A0R3SI85_HYMDI|nr:unnamed protein product [Hymenolepis diminuta]